MYAMQVNPLALTVRAYVRERGLKLSASVPRTRDRDGAHRHTGARYRACMHTVHVSERRGGGAET